MPRSKPHVLSREEILAAPPGDPAENAALREAYEAGAQMERALARLREDFDGAALDRRMKALHRRLKYREGGLAQGQPKHHAAVARLREIFRLNSKMIAEDPDLTRKDCAIGIAPKVHLAWPTVYRKLPPRRKS